MGGKLCVVWQLYYFAFSYQYMIGSIDTQAELAARTTETLVMANPNTWQFE